MRLLLFVGFLGSGKTTLVLALARRAAARGAPLAVIVNEVGEVGIDGQVLRVGDLEVVEITAGCICCQIGSDLVRALHDLDERFHPDLMIVEASGVASPAGVLDAVKRYPPSRLTRTQTVTLVDPTRFEALHEVLTPLIESQLTGADYVVITHSDEATEAEIQNAREAAVRLVPEARLYVVDATRKETLDELLGELLGELLTRRSPEGMEGWSP